MYRIQSPQTPLVRTQRYGEYHMDEFPSGTNMVVAVLAYTGAPVLGCVRCHCCHAIFLSIRLVGSQHQALLVGTGAGTPERHDKASCQTTDA